MIFAQLSYCTRNTKWLLARSISAEYWRHCPMTDLTPNDLSNLIFEEFNALSPQGEHAPGPKPLSPAAQAVLDAVRSEVIVELYAPCIAAAALRITKD